MKPATRLEGTVRSGVGIGLGLGATIGVVALVHGDARPLLRGAIKAGVVAAETGTRVAAQAKETFDDLYHEVVAERMAEVMARDEVHSSPRNEGAESLHIPRSA